MRASMKMMWSEAKIALGRRLGGQTFAPRLELIVDRAATPDTAARTSN